MKLMRVGVDLAKSVFQMHGVDRHEQVVWRRKLTRANWLRVFLETVEPGCAVGMEAAVRIIGHACYKCVATASS